jgi:hypothetical protein
MRGNASLSLVIRPLIINDSLSLGNSLTNAGTVEVAGGSLQLCNANIPGEFVILPGGILNLKDGVSIVSPTWRIRGGRKREVLENQRPRFLGLHYRASVAGGLGAVILGGGWAGSFSLSRCNNS